MVVLEVYCFDGAWDLGDDAVSVHSVHIRFVLGVRVPDRGAGGFGDVEVYADPGNIDGGSGMGDAQREAIEILEKVDRVPRTQH